MDFYDEAARLTILKALAEEQDYKLNDTILLSVLEQFAFSRGRDYLRNQLQWLESQVGAVKLHKVGTAVVAEITQAGLDHVERRQILAGVKKSSPIAG